MHRSHPAHPPHSAHHAHHPHPVRAVIFDFDGTLVDLKTDYPAMRAALGPVMQAAGWDGTTEGFWRTIGESDEAVRRAVFEIVVRFEAEGLERGDPIPGAVDVLEALGARGVRFAVVTRNSRETAAAGFRRYGFAPAAAIVGLEDVRRTKPDPEAGRLALAALGVEPSQCAMVGDTWHDMDMAAALGMYRVLRRNPLVARPPLDRADVVIDALAALLRLFEPI